MKTSITDFQFIPRSFGHYMVTYTSPVTGKAWRITTNDMGIIDATKNEDEPKRKDLERLKRLCKEGRQINNSRL